MFPNQKVITRKAYPKLPAGFMAFYFACSFAIDITFEKEKTLLAVVFL